MRKSKDVPRLCVDGSSFLLPRFAPPSDALGDIPCQVWTRDYEGETFTRGEGKGKEVGRTEVRDERAAEQSLNSDSGGAHYRQPETA